ncbi:MAG: methionyl-tRNA formyltransferase [Actinomycetota bacterium]
MIRVAFLGNDPWSVPPLETLGGASETFEIARVVTNPPRPAGRGSKLRPTSVAHAARAAGLPLLETAGVRSGEGLEALRALAPDAIVVVAYGELLTADVLDLPRFGCVNLHFSLLPRWRGAAPVQRAILEGDGATGVTAMLMDEGLDTGPILATREEPIGPRDDAGTLGQRLAGIGGALLVDTLPRLVAGEIEPVSQDHAGAVYAAKIVLEERELDWTRSVSEVDRRIRALAPEPGARTTFRGGALKILRARRSEIGDKLMAVPESGEIRVYGDGVVRVGTGEGSLDLLEVAPAGRRRMDAAAWARGARIQPGERLG